MLAAWPQPPAQRASLLAEPQVLQRQPRVALVAAVVPASRQAALVGWDARPRLLVVPAVDRTGGLPWVAVQRVGQRLAAA